MRIMRFRELLALLPLLNVGSAANVVSSSSCTSTRLQAKIEHFRSKPFDELFNGDSIPIKCDEGFEPMNSTAQAQCVEGVWEIPVDFRCVSQGFCRLPFEPGLSIKMRRTSRPRKKDPYKNIFHDGEQVIVNFRNNSFTQSFRCMKGTWDPDILP